MALAKGEKMERVLIKSGIQKQYNLDHSMAEVVLGYVGDGEKGFYIKLSPVNGKETTFFLSRDELADLVEGLTPLLDTTDDDWPDEK